MKPKTKILGSTSAMMAMAAFSGMLVGNSNKGAQMSQQVQDFIRARRLEIESENSKAEAILDQVRKNFQFQKNKRDERLDALQKECLHPNATSGVGSGGICAECPDCGLHEIH